MTFLAWNLFFSDAYLLYLGPTRHFSAVPGSVEKSGHPKDGYNDINDGSSPLAIDPKSKKAERSVCNSDWLSPHVLLVLLTLKCGWYRHDKSHLSVAKSSYLSFFYRYIPMFISYCVCSPFLFPVKKHAPSLWDSYVIHVVEQGRNVRRLAASPCGNVKINSYQFKVHDSPCLLLIPLLFWVVCKWSIRHSSTSWLVLVFPR